MDDRIISDPVDDLLRAVSGNLIYKKLKFTLIPDFSVSLQDKNIDQALNLCHKLHRIKMANRSRVFSITYIIIYAFTTSHHKNLKR